MNWKDYKLAAKYLLEGFAYGVISGCGLGLIILSLLS